MLNFIFIYNFFSHKYLSREKLTSLERSLKSFLITGMAENRSSSGKLSKLRRKVSRRILHFLFLLQTLNYLKWSSSNSIPVPPDLRKRSSFQVIEVQDHFQRSIHILLFQSSLDISGSDPVTPLIQVILMHPRARHVNKYWKMWPRVCKWKALDSIDRLCVWFSSQLY